MPNEHTKRQFREAFERDIREMQNPDPRVKLKKQRSEKAKKIAKRYGM